MQAACLVQVLQEPYAGDPVFKNLFFFPSIFRLFRAFTNQRIANKKKYPRCFGYDFFARQVLYLCRTEQRSFFKKAASWMPNAAYLCRLQRCWGEMVLALKLWLDFKDVTFCLLHWTGCQHTRPSLGLFLFGVIGFYGMFFLLVFWVLRSVHISSGFQLNLTSSTAL